VRAHAAVACAATKKAMEVAMVVKAAEEAVTMAGPDGSDDGGPGAA
jgi:hypothetical protein